MKIVKSLEDSGLLIKGVSETIKNETEEQNGGFLDMLLGTSSANLLGNMLSGKRVVTSPLCEKQNFRKKKVQREYHIFFFSANDANIIFSVKPNIIFSTIPDIFQKKSIEQDNYKKID